VFGEHSAIKNCSSACTSAANVCSDVDVFGMKIVYLNRIL
jgi:hypothetical protein